MNPGLIRRAGAIVATAGALRTARRVTAERADRRFMHIDPARDTLHELMPLGPDGRDTVRSAIGGREG